MIDRHVVQSLKDVAGEFVTQCIDDPQRCGLTKSEKLWMEELSKIYLTAELDIGVPDSPTREFSSLIAKATAFGSGSAIITRIILTMANFVSEKDFFTNTSSYMTTLERHQEDWSQKFLESHHHYSAKRPIEDFMHDYFESPELISHEELSYFLTLYFKHFYRLLCQFMLFYTQSQSTIYYGRGNP